MASPTISSLSHAHIHTHLDLFHGEMTFGLTTFCSEMSHKFIEIKPGTLKFHYNALLDLELVSSIM